MTEMEKIAEFLDKLDNLSTGDKAALKRNAGIILNSASGQAQRVFYRSIPFGIPQWQEERWFAIACFYCQYNKEDTIRTKDKLENMVGKLIHSAVLSESAAHRVESLLDTSWDTDGFMLQKLAQLLKLISSKQNITLDYGSLLTDLLHWNDDSQYTQRKWARAIYLTSPQIEEDREGEE